MKKKEQYLNKNNTMITVKRLFISLLVLFGCSAGAWAIEQDSDDYYLIGSVQDWEDFAALVKTTPTANAKMIADVDLDSSQAMLGDSEHEDRPTYYYQGTFDGQGYTLTVHYTGTSQTAPFAMISNATIKNVHVDGTITNSSGSQPSVIARIIYGTSTVENVWSSVVTTDTRTGWDEAAALVGCVDGYKSGHLVMNNCLFTGTVNSSGSYNGCFVGYINSGGSATITNCLSLGTFNYTGGNYAFRGSHTNCYVSSFPASYPSGVTKPTDEELADGTIATALGDAWVQDPETGQPMQKIFIKSTPDALNGEFSITDYGIKVIFSRGNLQYVNDTWQFAKHQYDYFGENQSNGRDMFTFNNYSSPNNDHTWFNLTHDQWVYLIRDRGVTNSLSDGARFTMATIGDTYKGVILFPDNYTHPEGTDFTAGVFNVASNFTASVSLEGWALMEAAGCVFMPACGWYSMGETWNSVGEAVVCSSTSVYPTGTRYYTPAFYFDRIDFNEWCNQATWTAVRLVQLSGLNRDDDGYYLIGSVEDWKECSSLLTINPAINIRMTADVDLGDDQTELGSVNNPYKGTFDGQGHALTVAYSVTSSSSDHVAPFASIENATIENLHVKGTITTAGMRPAGITSYVSGTSYIRNCWSEVDITSSLSSDIDAGGFVARVNSYQTLQIDDCTFTGSITYSNRNGFEAGGLVGWCQDAGVIQIQNSLFSPSSITTTKSSDKNKMLVSGYQNNVSFINCYYRKVGSLEQWIEQGIATSDEELIDCTTSAALQNGRSEDVWVQDPLTNQPLPIIFATFQDTDGSYLIRSVEDWRRFADIIKTTPTANAKMVADVDLGDDQTMMGINASTPYQGIFDGQGHTLTVNINATGVYVAVFRYVNGATIQGIHIAGSLHSDEVGLGGLVGSGSNTTIRQCRVSALLTTDKTYSGVRHSIGGIFSEPGESVLMEDCLFDGRIADQNNHFCGGFSNYSPYAVTIKNSLNLGIFPPCASGYSSETATFIRTDAGAGGSHVLTNLFYLNSFGITQGTQATETTLIDGSVTTALNNGQTGEEAPWVQDPTTGTPMLKLFAKDITYTVPSSGIGTFSAKGQVLLPEGLSAHYCTVYHKKNSTISVVNINDNIVPAATGVLLSGTPGETFTLTGACGQAPTITDNELVAVTESKHIPATDGDYTNFMMKGGKFIKIADDNASMPANRAYLPLLTADISGSNAKEIMLYWDDEEATGIESLTPGQSPMGEGSIYNLNGQKLSAPQKGINIINGRKVIVK